MKGVVEKIWENKTDDGKPYFVLKIGGEQIFCLGQEIYGGP